MQNMFFLRVFSTWCYHCEYERQTKCLVETQLNLMVVLLNLDLLLLQEWIFFCTMCLGARLVWDIAMFAMLLQMLRKAGRMKATQLAVCSSPYVNVNKTNGLRLG